MARVYGKPDPWGHWIAEIEWVGSIFVSPYYLIVHALIIALNYEAAKTLFKDKNFAPKTFLW